MQECDVQTLGTLAGLLVDEAHTLFTDFGESTGHTVLNAESYVMHTLVALVKPFLNGALGRCRLEQFQLHLTAAKEGGLHLLVLYYFCCITLQAQHVSEIRQALLNALNCDAQMLNVGNLNIFCI